MSDTVPDHVDANQAGRARYPLLGSEFAIVKMCADTLPAAASIAAGQGLAISLLFGLASSTLLTVLISAIYIVMSDDGRGEDKAPAAAPALAKSA